MPRTEQQVTERIKELFEAGSASSEEVAMAMVDEDVAAGDYEGCSTELELAYDDYVSRANYHLSQQPTTAHRSDGRGGPDLSE